MIINFNDKTGSVKENYIQSLVLLFLPCESFSKDDNGENRFDGCADLANGNIYVDVRLKVGDRLSEKKAECAFDKNIKLQIKNFIGKTFLDAAEAVFGYKSPWGIVTGIRPAKLAADYLTSHTKEETLEILKNQYFTTDIKAEMCVRTAQNELRLTKDIEDNTCSLYISIPFCPSKCRYCSFVSSTTPRLLSLIPEYVASLETELLQISQTAKALGLKVKTAYVGGGTPAILSAQQISFLLDAVDRYFCVSELDEFTFEAGRPDCITEEKLKAINSGGVGRISINTQTANNDILNAVGRKHTYEDYLKCMDMARNTCIKCINTDLIAGLPGESEESFCESLDRVAQVSPENLTVHSFTLKRSSEYKTANSATVDANSLAAQRMVAYSSEKLIKCGYEPYYMYRQKNTVGNLDNTGYSLPGFECLYNIYMMGEYHTVFSAGAGAVSKYVSRDRTRIERVFSPKYPYEYLDKNKYTGFNSKFAEDFYNNLY